MITAIDSNVLLDILIPNEAFADAAAAAIENAAAHGSLIVPLTFWRAEFGANIGRQVESGIEYCPIS